MDQHFHSNTYQTEEDSSKEPGQQNQNPGSVTGDQPAAEDPSQVDQLVSGEKEKTLTEYQLR